MTTNFNTQCLFLSFLTNLFLMSLSTVNIREILTKQSSIEWLHNQTSSNKNPYCSICCMDYDSAVIGRKCNSHTMCIYATKDIGPACKGLIHVEFTQDEKDVIVDAHNTLRNRVASGLETAGNPGPQPTASNMRLMFWDNELGLIAKRWASQCIFARDICRDTGRFPVGQNIAKGQFAASDDIAYIGEWYGNVEFFNATNLRAYKKYYNDDVSNAYYTQVVWADTYLVGCARVAFQKADGPNVTYQEHFVCNYGPSGNIAGQSVYRIGEPCSSCLDGTGCASVEYPALCGNEIIPPLNYRKFRRNKKLEQNTGRTKLVEIMAGSCENVQYKLTLIACSLYLIKCLVS